MPSEASSTLRAPVRLPPMPTEVEAIDRFSPVKMARAHLADDHLVFDEPEGFERALEEGFFLLAIPPGLDHEAGDRFARNFYLPPATGELAGYTGFRGREVPGAYQGYFDRKHDQWENFYIERGNWGMLPSKVAELGRVMATLGIGVLRATLRRLSVSERDWPLVTSGLSKGGGHQMFAFNHFRSDMQARGSKFHRDSGWVTVLRSTDRGLLAYIGGGLRSIDPEPGYFIVNFGSSIEVLTADLLPPVRANVHGVVRTIRPPGQPDRVSYAIFLDSALGGDIFRYGPDGPRRVQSVTDFAAQEVMRTYDGNDDQL